MHKELHEERELLIRQWRAEFEAELDAAVSHHQNANGLADENF
jgi:hypothetical protein